MLLNTLQLILTTLLVIKYDDSTHLFITVACSKWGLFISKFRPYFSKASLLSSLAGANPLALQNNL